MYKSKLLELCRHRAWELPNYEATKQGMDHNPQFYATVTVNGFSFRTQSPSNTSKKAQNDAAKLAFDRFSFSRPFSSSSSHMQYLFKNQLQTYAQKRNLALPVYSSERVGPPHASRFKCKVTVDGQIYESEEYFPTLSKAEHAVAKAALMTLLPDGVENDESGFKNLLQELAQKEGLSLPAYCTKRYGEAHMPDFFSTVEIEGETFTGLTAKTKKQAEMSAAKGAYILLQLRKSSQRPPFRSAASQAHEAPRTPMHLSPSCQVQEALQSSPTCASPSDKGHEALQSLPTWRKEYSMIKKYCSGVASHHSPIASPALDSGLAVESVPSSSGTTISSSSEHSLSSSSLPCGSPASLATSSSIESLVGKSTSGTIVHPCATAVRYPARTIALPFSDDEWVAVRTQPHTGE